MYTSSPVPQYGQEHEVGGEEKDTTTGFRRFGIGNSPEVPWSVMTQGHCLAHFPRRHTTTYTVTPIKDFDIFIHNMKDVDICLVRWVSDGNCSRTVVGSITEDTTHRKGSRSLGYVGHRNVLGNRSNKGTP
jgi:hypothetical protein